MSRLRWRVGGNNKLVDVLGYKSGVERGTDRVACMTSSNQRQYKDKDSCTSHNCKIVFSIKK